MIDALEPETPGVRAGRYPRVMTNCLVCGCTGFIGSHLVQALLQQGVQVRGLSRQADVRTGQPGMELVRGDLTDPASLRGLTRGIDTVIHAAGFAHTAPENRGLHDEVTVAGTRHLLAEALATGVERLVFISSVKAMPEPGSQCLDESATGPPVDEYGMSRYQAEQLVLAAGRESGMHVCILRPVLVYGAGCKGNLGSMLRWIDRGLFPPLPDTGNRRSMVDVRDLVSAILLAAEQASANGRTCIIADGQDYSTRRIYTAMRAALGKSTTPRAWPAGLLKALARAGDGLGKILGHSLPFNSGICARLLDSACYRSVLAGPALGFLPLYRLEDALPGMVETYRRHGAGRTRKCP